MADPIDPRRVVQSKDMEGAILYAKQISNDASDAWPVLVDAAGNLCVNMTVGTVSLSSTASVITNAAGNPVNVALSSTKVTIESSSGLNVTLSSTNVTVDNIVRDLAGNLCVNMTVGTVSLSSTASTITNAIGNPVNVSLSATSVTVNNGVGAAAVPVQDGGNSITIDGSVSLTSTEVTVKSAVAGFNVNIATATLGTVTVALSSTAVSVSNVVGTPIFVTLTPTVVSVVNAVGTPIYVTNTTTAVTVTNSVSTIPIVGRTLTGSTGSLSATNGSITLTPTNKIKVYAISLTTTSATELICIFNSGGVANGLELWRASLMAPAGTNAGLNLAVTPPNFLFASRSGTSVSLSLNTATLVHYSISYFDEA
jgi:hypothetical protein